jgi:hypothetical protein
MKNKKKYGYYFCVACKSKTVKVLTLWESFYYFLGFFFPNQTFVTWKAVNLSYLLVFVKLASFEKDLQ